MSAQSTYEDIEYVLAEIITEATGEPRVGRLERTIAKEALARLRELGLALSTPPADDVREALGGLSAPESEAMRDAREALEATMVTQELREALAGVIRNNLGRGTAREVADAILAAPGIEVRPHGTVTDAGSESPSRDDPEPWVDQDGHRWSTAKKDGYLSRGPSTFEFTFSPRFDVRPHGTVTPTVDEWSAQMDAERARQVEHGYDDAHDAEHGAAHLLNWAIDYARRGNNLAAATMVRCALRIPRGPITDAEVNEAVDIIAEEILEDESIDSLDLVLAKSAARRILAEVCPRGTVTAAEVEAAARAYAGDEMSAAEWEWAKTQPEVIEPYLTGMRAALKAAREARS